MLVICRRRTGRYCRWSYLRGEIGEVTAEVLHGAAREDERVVEGGVGETYWCCRHDVLVRAVAVVSITVMMRSETEHTRTQPFVTGA